MKNFTQQSKPYQDFVQALKTDDETQVQIALMAMAQHIGEQVLADARELAGERDAAVLAQRGVRQLTGPEHAYYQAVIKAMKSDSPRQALTNMEVTLPETIVDAVMDDIQSQFPLLNAITVTNTTAITKWIINKQGAQLATWGALATGITTELSGAFDTLDMTACKLTAYFPVPKDYLILGPAWLDRYVRAVLAEANAAALEKAIITGTGKNEPIGMDRDISDEASVKGQVYPQKNAVKLDSFGVKDYLAIVKGLTSTPTGRSRPVNNVALICNPADYFSVIRPATTMLTPTGSYATDIFPFPTTVYQSSFVAEGEAIMGLLPRYFLGLGTSRDGLIEYDDSVKFLDDVRVYATKLLGNGRPMDENAFVRLNISGITEEAAVPVKVKGTVSTKAEGAAAANVRAASSRA